MREIQVPKVIRALKVAEYAEEFGDFALMVWVNPPGELFAELLANLRKILTNLRDRLDESQEENEQLDRRNAEILAELWSQGSDPETRASLEEVLGMRAKLADTDPRLWYWLRNQTIEMIVEHRTQEKKR